MIPVRGLFETHLAVRDVKRSADFYRDVVGLIPAYPIPAADPAFLWVGESGGAMLGLWQFGSPIKLTSHFALRVDLADLFKAPAWLKSVGVTPLGFDETPVDEPDVIGWMPAAVLYFHDPDGHLVEYLSMLPDAPQADFGHAPYSQWLMRAGRTA